MPPDPATVPEDLDLDDEQYDSAEDEDFEVDGAQDDADVTSDESDDEAAEPANKKRKTGEKGGNDAQVEELDSGDEAMVQKAKARREKKGKGKKAAGGGDEDEGDVDFDDEEEGGTGGFVRTRAMKMRTQEERKPLARIDGATVDVDALWKMMNSPDAEAGSIGQDKNDEKPSADEETKDTEMRDGDAADASQKTQQGKYPEEMIKIKRTYKFAGEMITEEKVVHKDSAEAKIFLANEKGAEAASAAEVEDAANARAALNLRRPLRKISRFDPNPTGSIKKSWEKQPAGANGAEENARGPKINTVEKSRLDWAAYVDQAGIKDELKVHSKAKEGYHGRMDFLNRVDAKKDEDARNARLKGM